MKMKTIQHVIILLSTIVWIFLLSSCKENNPIQSNDSNIIQAWTEINNGPPVGIRTLTSVGNSLYAYSNYKLYISSDDGDSWAIIGKGLPDSSTINGIAGNNNYLVAATLGKGVFISSDFGENWYEPNNFGLNEETKYVNSIVMGSKYLFIGAGTDAIVFRSSDLGKNWTGFNNGLPPSFPIHIPYINTLVKLNNTLFACPDFEGIYFSDNQGESWQSNNEGLPEDAFIWDIASSDSFYFATEWSSDNGIYRRNFNSSNWIKIDNIKVSGPQFIVAQGSTILASAASGIIISFNNGNTWQTCNNGLEGENPMFFNYAIIHNDYVFFAGHNKALYRYSLN